MNHHPAADAFPMMDGQRYSDLLEDIKKNGQIEPITICDGMILDGRNRYKACQEAGIEPKTREYKGDPWCYAWSLNGQRRDLGQDQRYLIWKFCNENSASWQAEKKRIADEANAKRSEAAKERPREKDGTMKAQPVDAQLVQLLDEEEKAPAKPKKEAKERKAKAEASKTNIGAVHRGDKLAKDRPDLAEKVRKGEIKPTEAYRKMKSDEIKTEIRPPDGKYRVIYADPPWSYGNTQPDYQTEQRDHYPVMSLAEICALPIKEIAEDNAVLFLWVTSPILEESFQVVKSWGFKYKSAFIWDKIKHNMGHYNSVRHELLLICTRGACQPDERKLFDSVQSIERTEHSKKPDEFYSIIETLYNAGEKIELFARRQREGWAQWGNQA